MGFILKIINKIYQFFLYIFEIVFFKKEIFIKEKKDVVFVLFYSCGCCRLYELLTKLKLKGVEIECLSREPKEFSKDFFYFNLFYFGNIVFYFLLFYFILKKYEPNVIVIQELEIPKFIKFYINKKKVKLVNLMDYENSFCKLYENRKYFRDLNYDFYFIWGKKSYEKLHGNSVNDLRIILSGSSFFQRYKRLPYEKRYFILIQGPYFPKKYQKTYYKNILEYYQALNEIIKKYDNYIFLFKPHPEILFKSYLRKYYDIDCKYILIHRNVFLVNYGINIYYCLRYCKLLISDVSVSTIESAAAGCPFIIFDWLYNKNKEYTVSNELGDMEFFERATNKEELEELFKKRVSRDFFINSQEKLYSYYKLHIEVENSIDYIADYLKNIIDNIKVKT